mgnify:CR=1 FL=1
MQDEIKVKNEETKWLMDMIAILSLKKQIGKFDVYDEKLYLSIYEELVIRGVSI